MSTEPQPEKIFIERAYRTRTYKSAFVYNEGGGGKRACILKNVSDTGALLHIEDVGGLPLFFKVGVELDAYQVEAKWIWRKDIRLGVQFQGPLEQLKSTRKQVLQLSDDPILAGEPSVRGEEYIKIPVSEHHGQLFKKIDDQQQRANLRRLKQRRSTGFGKR